MAAVVAVLKRLCSGIMRGRQRLICRRRRLFAAAALAAGFGFGFNAQVLQPLLMRRQPPLLPRLLVLSHAA